MNFKPISWKWHSSDGVVLIESGGACFHLRAEDWGEGVIRVLVQPEPAEHRPPFLLGRGKPIKPQPAGDGIAFESGRSVFILNPSGFWEWHYKGRLLLRGADDYYISFRGPRTFAPPLALNKSSADISFHLHPDEPVYGGGETFGYLNKRRQRLHMRIADPCGLTSTPYSYKHIPLFWSPRGWGIFACTNYPVMADIGATSFISFNLRVEEPCLDIFLMPGGPGDIIRHYWRLTGAPPLPPRWGLGVWWSRCMYKNAAEVKEVVDELRRARIGGDVIGLDPLWLKNRPSWKWDACDFVWSEENFGRLEDFSSWLHGRGFKLCLWQNPHVWLGGESYKRLKPFLLKDEEGRPAKSEPPLCGHGIVQRLERVGLWDFTSHAAWDERKRLLGALLKRGADAFKVDYGEGAPGDALHNVYPFLYLKNTWEAIAEAHGEADTMVWARPGWSGCQRFPGCWAGDSQSTFYSMGSTLAGLLSLAASGVPWWASDIGGFHHYTGRPPSPELYLRWAEWGMLSPLARFHGTTPREPWHFGEGAVRAVRRLIRLRESLIPYMIESYKKLADAGLPLARPLVMDYPDDPATWDMATEYLFGTSLLVAPVLEEGAAGRSVYLPAGTWRRFGEKGDVKKGPVWIEASSRPGTPIIFELIK